MFKIGYRTVKTAIGITIAIYISQLLHLDGFISAGIITIFCIQKTKKQSLRTSWDRFLACCTGMIFSYVFFGMFGFHALVIGLMFLVLIPVLVKLKVHRGIGTCSVVILHLYSSYDITLAVLKNELILVLVGIGTAFIVNLYMPSLDGRLLVIKGEIEHKYRIILKEISRYLRTNHSDWTGKELVESEKLISKGKTMAFTEIENHYTRNEDTYYHYFKLREKQLDVLQRMTTLAASSGMSSNESKMIADFFDMLSKNVHHYNTSSELLRELNIVNEKFKNLELPRTHEEFERRSALLQLLKEIRGFIIIKSTVKPFPELTGIRKGSLS